MRLEQGRDHHPSVHVIDALARALQLDDDATAHLHSLAHPAPVRRRVEEPEQAPTSIKAADCVVTIDDRPFVLRAPARDPEQSLGWSAF